MSAAPRFISQSVLKTQPEWSAAIAALRCGHMAPKASITDSFLSHGNGRMVSRMAKIDGLGAAVKTFSVRPDNPHLTPPLPSVQGVFTLYDDITGAPVALIDFQLLTYWKTAADSVLGTLLVGPDTPRSLVIVGAGTMARALCEAYAATFPSLETIILCARRRDRAAALIDSLCQVPVHMEASDDIQAAVQQADIVATATTSETPVIAGKWLQPGAHVDLVGAYAATMREADDETLQRGHLYVDSRDTTIRHIGELMIPLASGAVTVSDIRGDYYDLIAAAGTEKQPVRADGAITVVKNGGGAHLDLMMAVYLQGLV